KAELTERDVGQVSRISESEQSRGEAVRISQAAIMVDNDHRGLDLAEYLPGCQAERRRLARPHRIDMRRGFAVRRHNRSAGRSGRLGDEHIRGDAERQRRRGIEAPTARTSTRHLHVVLAGHQRYLAAGLYPDVLQFKHECGIALELFTDPPDSHGYGAL